jgi:hypothetical protein
MKNKLLDIDAVFDGFEIDETSVNRFTANSSEEKRRKQSESIRQRYADSDYKLMREKMNANLTTKEKRTAAAKRFNADPVVKAKMIASRSITRSDPNYRPKKKPVMTPAGAFMCRKLAAEYYGVLPDTITDRIKKGNGGYWFLTWEEFDNLEDYDGKK